MRETRIFDENGYNTFLEIMADDERFSNYRRASLEICHCLNRKRKEGKLNERDWDLIFERKDIYPGEKISILSTLFRERMESFLLPFRKLWGEATHQEMVSLCKFYDRSPESAKEVESVAARKEACNLVMEDALVPFGFKKFYRMKGLDIYEWEINDTCRLVIELDSASVGRPVVHLLFPPWIYIPSLDIYTYLLIEDHKGETKKILLAPRVFCYAAERPCKYSDLAGLEVAIRGQMLYKKLAMPRVEEIALKLQRDMLNLH